jgi:hypothetical protein
VIGMAHPVVAFLAAAAAAYALALALYPISRLRARWVLPLCGVLTAATLGTPLLISAQQVVPRAFAALIAVDVFFKLVDFTRLRIRGPTAEIGWSEFCQFLVPLPVLLVVHHRKRRSRTGDRPWVGGFVRFAAGGSLFAACVAALLMAGDSAALRRSFLLDHVAKVILFLIAIESLSQGFWGLERLAGFDCGPIIAQSFLARTPSEFWRRYNQRVHDWLYFNVFVPAGGARAPVRGAIAVFLVSAALHELMFGIATSRFDGYQGAFFLLQAPAVILSGRAARRADSWGMAQTTLARAATALWLAVTSILFLHGVDRVFPMVYVSRPWLP